MTLGLRRHTVRVVEPDPEWLIHGKSECASLRRNLGDLAAGAQHVGSTAVPGLPAKPILDFAVAVKTSRDVPEIVTRLAHSGYIYRGDAGDKGGHLFVKDEEPDVRTMHLHVVEIADPQWRNYMGFRDRLRADAELRERYAALKVALAKRHPDDRQAYTAGKDAFVRGVLGEA